MGRFPGCGVIEAVRETFPWNPYRLATTMVEKPEEPAVMFREDGDADREKSGGKGGVTETKTATEWISPPLVPVMFST